MPRFYRERFAVTGDRRAQVLRERIGSELHSLRLDVGFTQAQLARRAEVAQSVVCDIEAGRSKCSIETYARLTVALGYDLGTLRVFPGNGISLRDSGQLGIAEVIVAAANPVWRPNLEVPVGEPPDRRAADVVLLSPTEALHIEIMRGLFELDSQHRRERLKQEALTRKLGVPVRLVLAFPDRASTRRTVSRYTDIISVALPRSSRAVWSAIRAGEPLGADGLLWVPTRGDRLGKSPVGANVPSDWSASPPAN